MTHDLMQRELILHLNNGDFDVRNITNENITGPVDYGWVRYKEECQTRSTRKPPLMTWGGGLLAGSRIPGTRRLVFCGYSPQWEGFYISSMGGAAYIMHRIGVDFISIYDSAPIDSVLILNHNNGQVSVRLEPINVDSLWAGYPGPDGEWLVGYYALQQAVFDRYQSEYDNDWLRIFAVGPGARFTNQGIIGSNHIKNGKITPIDDWAGRGGFGSRLLQTHHIAACIFGGDWEDPDLKDSKEIDGYFRQYYGESMIKVDLGATEKYRYAPGFQTGGTFGVNMHTVDDKLFGFNYSSIDHSKAERLAQHKTFITDHYLKQFNQEIIEPKNFNHCGEPCGVVCKKYDRQFKKDYEPYQALGPLCGVFDQRAAENLNHFTDSMGLDAIQIGGTVAWVMELIELGMLRPDEWDLPRKDQLKFTYSSNLDQFNLVKDSALNASYAIEIIRNILTKPKWAIFREGIRVAAYHLNQILPSIPGQPSIIDRAVFLSHGENGCMTPNQYWVPGMFAPMPMMGKYFVYYGVDFLPPKELGKKCVHRMVYELFSDNSGICRFHRKWVEAIVDDIISAHYQYPNKFKNHQFELSKEIFNWEKDDAVFWESERTIDIVFQFLKEWYETGLHHPELLAWISRFNDNKLKAAREFWTEIRDGIQEAFDEGPAAIPEIVPPYQAARQDIMDSKKNPDRTRY